VGVYGVTADPKRLVAQIQEALSGQIIKVDERDLMVKIDPQRFLRLVAEYRKGAPSANLNDGGRSSETRLPLEERYDKTLGQLKHDYLVAIERAAGAIQKALRIQNMVCIPVAKTVECVNRDVGCKNILSEGREKGECNKCKVHRHRNGERWTEQQEETLT
jgi:hypothetical protein